MLNGLFSDKYLVTILHCDLHIYLMGVCKSSFGAVNLISQDFILLSKMCKKGRHFITVESVARYK